MKCSDDLPIRGDVAITHAWTDVDGVRVFHREAGPRDAPAVVMLHGFPSSSRMFKPLFPALADR
jgi:pimeloyl-ACP methyl ester carboxylesterase